jgi:hypothetical protein
MVLASLFFGMLFASRKSAGRTGGWQQCIKCHLSMAFEQQDRNVGLML